MIYVNPGNQSRRKDKLSVRDSTLFHSSKRSRSASKSRHDGDLLLMFGEFLYHRLYKNELHLFVMFLQHCTKYIRPRNS